MEDCFENQSPNIVFHRDHFCVKTASSLFTWVYVKWLPRIDLSADSRVWSVCECCHTGIVFNARTVCRHSLAKIVGCGFASGWWACGIIYLHVVFLRVCVCVCVCFKRYREPSIMVGKKRKQDGASISAAKSQRADRAAARRRFFASDLPPHPLASKPALLQACRFFQGGYRKPWWFCSEASPSGKREKISCLIQDSRDIQNDRDGRLLTRAGAHWSRPPTGCQIFGGRLKTIP